jgi:hypothetical protein
MGVMSKEKSAPAIKALRMGVGAIALFSLAACGSSGGTTGSTLSNLFFFNSTTPPPESKTVSPDDEVDCPRVEIFEGGAALRAFGGAVGDANALRNQISIAQVARECTPTGGGGLTIKVGVEGRALIGPVGAPGTFTAPLNILIKRGETVVARRTRTVSVTVPAGDTQGSFVVVEEGIAVPAGSGDLGIEVGLGAGGGKPETPQRRKRR